MVEEKVLMKGNEAIAEAAIRAGCGAYFGYPITPQNELIAYMSKHMLDRDRIFIQAESEIAAINMVYGAAATGVRAMTSSSGPGMSLKQEGISYAAGARLPMVIINIMRAGPGLGSIAPAQGDYNQAVRGGGHGDYRLIVLAPNSVQEAADLTYLSFDLTEKYRTPTMLLADGLLGQMMEGLALPPERDMASLPDNASWSVGYRAKTHRNTHYVSSVCLDPVGLEKLNTKLFEVYAEIEKNEIRYESINCDQADLVFVAFGTASRVCMEAIQMAKEDGIELGLLRPISLFPFPNKQIRQLADQGKRFLVVEMNRGQMVNDVRLAVNGKADVHFYGRDGGMIPNEYEVLAAAKQYVK